MENLRISQIFGLNTQADGQINIFDNNNNNINEKIEQNNLNNSLIFLDNLNKKIQKKISDSVLDLVNCFICLTPVKDPLSCPKCNNFACKSCLEQYFGNSASKKCPLCKRDIQLNELKENKIIGEIEKIINDSDTTVNKADQMAALTERKKREWKGQGNYISNLIEKIFKFQENLQKTKEKYENFVEDIRKLIEKTFEEYNRKIENLVNSLLMVNNNTNLTIKKYDDIKEKSSTIIYNKNIKSLINEVLSLERQKFNMISHDEAEAFINMPIRIIPSINMYHPREITIRKNQFQNNIDLSFTGNHFKLGAYELTYNSNGKIGYQTDCKLVFTLMPDNNKKMCFIISQAVIYGDKKEKVIIMNFIKNEGKTYTYECNLTFDEFYSSNENEVKIKTEALIYSM